MHFSLRIFLTLILCFTFLSSLAYDIITNGNNGELSVVSKVNEGSTFTILLPAD